MSGPRETVCITGATGMLGSWVVKTFLEAGFTVKATVRDTSSPRCDFLKSLPEAGTRLHLMSGCQLDNVEQGGFKEALVGCYGLIHTATPLFIPLPGKTGWKNSTATGGGNISFRNLIYKILPPFNETQRTAKNFISFSQV